MKIAILGFGIEGKDAAQYFLNTSLSSRAERGELIPSKGGLGLLRHDIPRNDDVQITVFDKKEKEEIDAETFLQGVPLQNQKGIIWRLGDDYLKGGLNDFDLVVRSPGVRPDLPEILEAVKNGTKLTSNTQIFLDEVKVPVIAVTGTKGKGTTSTMITRGLEAAGKKVFLAGNIGEPMLAGIEEANNSDYAVLELSSFQTMDLTKSPHVVVVTNITSDHMDWHLSQKEYIDAKINLWAFQTKKDYFVFNWQDPTLRDLIGKKPTPGVVMRYTQNYNPECYVYTKDERDDSKKWTEIWCKDVYVGNTDELKVPGKHNIDNAMAAIATIGALGEGLEKVWQGIIAFEGLEHRLEKVAEIEGVLYINDSYATNPEPTFAALSSYSQPKILIAGGSEKNADFTQLGENIAKLNVKALLLIGVTADRIEDAVKEANYNGIIEKGFPDMPSVVKRASELSVEGDVVLLSPACASFGMFQNYKERGKKFKESVAKLSF